MYVVHYTYTMLYLCSTFIIMLTFTTYLFNYLIVIIIIKSQCVCVCVFVNKTTGFHSRPVGSTTILIILYCMNIYKHIISISHIEIFFNCCPIIGYKRERVRSGKVMALLWTGLKIPAHSTQTGQFGIDLINKIPI